MEMYKCVLVGIDTLEIGYCIASYQLAEIEWELIRNAKEAAQATKYDKGSSITFRGIDFEVQRTGSSRYKYILVNDDIQVKIFEDARGGTNFPELRITFRSAFLWRKGWMHAVLFVDEWIKLWAIVAEVKISRIDVMGDFATTLPILTPELREVVSRSRKKTEHGTYSRHADGNKPSGYDFGSDGIKCRIYDKTKEIVKSNKKWFEVLWKKNGWVEGESVTRIEFQCRRTLIKEFQINTLDDMFKQINDLWRYLTQDWFTIRIISEDTHRTRWDVTDFWKFVQDTKE